ncbi:hypothetical protein [Paenibacillus planticolens]|nr:hypothetical protein [Paenibacillus planticolens]
MIPTSGTIHVDGVGLDQMNEKERTLFRRERVGFIWGCECHHTLERK